MTKPTKVSISPAVSSLRRLPGLPGDGPVRFAADSVDLKHGHAELKRVLLAEQRQKIAEAEKQIAIMKAAGALARSELPKNKKD